MIEKENNMKKTKIAYLLAALLYLGLTSFAFAGSKEITVSAAISLKNAFEEMGKLYESKTGTACIFNFGASGDLLKQIAGGRPWTSSPLRPKRIWMRPTARGWPWPAPVSILP